MTETNIRAWRKKHGLSQKKLANLAKINVITLRMIENGKSKPLAETLQKLQDAMKAIEAKPAKAKKRKAAARTKPVAKPPAPMIDLKSWRKKHGLSQAKLSKLAKVSLNTILNMEAGKHEPMKGTVQKLQDAIKAIEAKPAAEVKPVEKPPAEKPATPVIDLQSWRKKHGLSQAKLSKLAKVSLNTILNMEAGKGKPRADTLEKIKQAIRAIEAKPAAEVKPAKAKKRKAVPKTKPARKGRGKSRKTTETGPIKLSNVDLELLNRILNMSESEKIELLKKMM